MRKRQSLDVAEESLTPLKKTREMLALSPAGFGPTDECRASPLRAAGTPLSSRRRARPAQEEDEAVSTPRASKRGPAAPEEEATAAGQRREPLDPTLFVPSTPFVFAAPGGLFTGVQVAAMVTGAVRDRERQLRDEYDALLADRLDEQWRTFAKFNEDQLHAQLGRSQHDYYS